MTEKTAEQQGFEWQRGIWDRISQIYRDEIDLRFTPVVEHALSVAQLRAGQTVLDLGCGTGAVTVRAARHVEPGGRVVGVDPSTDMLRLGERCARDAGVGNIDFREGRAEAIPAEDSEFDALIASLSMMYAIDREMASQECARVLRPGGRFVAVVWGGPDICDLVRFQQTVGRFAPPPPMPGVGPGALADSSPFLRHLADAGIDAHAETEVVEFDFDSLESAWDIVASVTASQMSTDQVAEAKAAIKAEMWPDADRPRRFRNTTQFIIGERG